MVVKGQSQVKFSPKSVDIYVGEVRSVMRSIIIPKHAIRPMRSEKHAPPQIITPKNIAMFVLVAAPMIASTFVLLEPLVDFIQFAGNMLP